MNIFLLFDINIYNFSSEYIYVYIYIRFLNCDGHFCLYVFATSKKDPYILVECSIYTSIY
jgi:hypothetical protein